MTDADFELWESAHILATGANASQLRDVLEANRATFRGMNATYEELCEATQRILDTGVIPSWPNEHIAALVKNLHALRAERAKRAALNQQVERRGIVQRRRAGCNFRLGVCCNGETYPECQKVQERWDAEMAAIRPKKKSQKKGLST